MEGILAERVGPEGAIEFLVKWHNYTAGESTWEPEKHMNCEDKVKIFRQQQALVQAKRVHVQCDSSDGPPKLWPADAPITEDEMRVCIVVMEKLRDADADFELFDSPHCQQLRSTLGSFSKRLE